MVTDLVLNWWFGLVGWCVDQLPSDTSPISRLDLSWITDMNYFLPVSEMFGVWLSLVSLGGFFAGSSLLIWVLIGIIRGGAVKA